MEIWSPTPCAWIGSEMKPPFFFTVQHIMISYMHNSIKPYKTLLSHNLFFLKAPWKTFPRLEILRWFFPIHESHPDFFGRSPQRTNQHRSPVGESATSGEYNRLLICWRGGFHMDFSTPVRPETDIFFWRFFFPNTTRIPQTQNLP